MVREALREDPPVASVDFDPWMFSGVEQLVGRFFEETSKRLPHRKDQR
jgi:predicted KAP-like P-loop ATPase